MDCAICLAEPQNPMTVPCCSQTFCSDCLKTWTELRSRCPLCISSLGQTQKNKLVHQTSTDFDNGSLMLETELATILQKASYLRRLYLSKSEMINNSKTHFKKSNLAYVGEQMTSSQEFLQFAQVAVNEGDRVLATGMMQRVTEMLMEIQLVLKGEKTVCFQEFQYSSEQEYEADYDYYQQQVYEKNQKTKYKNAKLANKKKQRVN